MKRITGLLGGAIALLMAMGLAPATAQNTGIYIGVNGGYQMGSTEVDLNVPAVSLLNIDGLASKGMTGGVQGGFDYRFPSSPFVLGVFAEYNPLGEADFSITTGLGGGVNIVSSTMDNEMKGGIRAGYVTSNNSLLYAGLFVSKADLKWTLLNGALTGSEDMKGKGFVAGIQVPLAANISAGLQYSYTQYDTVSYTLGGGPLKLDLDTEVQAVTGRINFHFGALETKAAPLK